MAIERRLAVGALVLLAALPVGVPLALQPGPDLALAALVLLATLVMVWLPVGPRIIAGAAVLGAGVLLAQGATLAPPATSLATAVLPALALTAGLGVASAAGAAALGLAAWWALAPPSAPAWGWLDGVGAAVLVGVGVGLALGLVRAAFELRVRDQVLRSGRAVREAFDRERLLLHKLAGILAPAHSPWVRGQGWSGSGMGLAAELHGGRALVGHLLGDPLTTLSAGWYLRAWARGGQLDPRALFALVHSELDELLAGVTPPWLGVLDRPAGTLRWVDARGRYREVAVEDMVVGHAGPGGEPVCWEPPPPPELLPGWEPLPPLPQDEVRSPGPWAALAWGALAVVAITVAVATGVLGALALAVPGAAALGRALQARARKARRLAEEEAEEAMELRDEVHRRLARDHGSLLPHKLAAGHVQVTAHRLRGDGLDASFTELFLDGARRIHVVAGEMAGACVCDRFLALSAGIYARALAVRGVRWPELFVRTRRLLDPDTHQLYGGPPRLVLGHAVVSEAGACEGVGALATLVLAGSGEARVVERGQVDDGHRVYFSPATVRPGPEEDMPALRPAVAAARVCELIESGSFDFERESLASLFARVFDGEQAPAHGTLLEVASCTPARPPGPEGQAPHEHAA